MCGSSDEPTSRHILPVELLERLTDVHCHPSDDTSFERGSSAIESLSLLHTRQLCAQSSNLDNQPITRDLYLAHPERVIPFFGIHPWFVHTISLSDSSSPPSKEKHYASLFPASTSEFSIPHPSLRPLLRSLRDPISLSAFLSALEFNLIRCPSAHIGEIGLDKAFRLPLPPSLVPEHGPKNSELQTPLSHQLALVEAQFDLAIRLQRHVSFHSVRSPMDTVKLLEKYRNEKPGFESIHVCLHSFGGSPETVSQLQRVHLNVFFSFATCISGRSPRFAEMLQRVNEERLLVESDYSDTSKIDIQITEIVEAICSARAWTVEDCVDRLEANWRRFLSLEAVGSGKRKKSKRERKLDEAAHRRQAGSDAEADSDR